MAMSSDIKCVESHEMDATTGSDALPFQCRLLRVDRSLAVLERADSVLRCGSQPVFPEPGVVVRGLGEELRVTLPLEHGELLRMCHSIAPTDGEQITSGDAAWELSRRQFRISSVEWREFIDGIVASCYLPIAFISTLEVEARLRKLLVYGAGGSHKDSGQKQPAQVGTVGTLLVVLPGEFTGGELVVYAPGSSKIVHTWDASAMDPLAVKYAVVYGDRPLEIKPVTGGYRVCLQYDLVSTDPNQLAKLYYTWSLPLYDSISAALFDFFSQDGEDILYGKVYDDSEYEEPVEEPQPLEPFVLTDPRTHRRATLMYLLDHNFNPQGLSLKTLKHRDALVATSLLRFCEQSGGAFELLVGATDYVRQWDDSATDSGEYCDIKPIPWDYDAKYASTKEPQAAILNLMPVRESWLNRFDEQWDPLTKMWLPLVTSNPAIAVYVASLYAEGSYCWSSVGSGADAVLDAVAQLNNIHVLEDILVGCSELERQPKLRDVGEHFEWDAVVAMAKATQARWPVDGSALNTLRLVLSLLDGVQDVSRISSLLTAVKPEPFVGEVDGRGKLEILRGSTPLAEYVELLRLASRVSVSLVRELARRGSASALVQLVVPALLAVNEHGSLLAPLQEARTRLELSLPELRHEWYRVQTWSCPVVRLSECALCAPIRSLLASEDSLRVELDDDQHVVQGKLDMCGLARQPAALPTKTAIVKMYECEVYQAAITAMAVLDDVLALGWAGAKTNHML